MELLIQKAIENLAKIRNNHPLVHNITNYVVMNFTANALLCIGAAPVMAHALEEVEEMTGISSCLVINIGTLSRPWIKSMLKAGKAARDLGIPVVLDPVGAGATAFRTETSMRILEEVKPSIIRGNASEILAITKHGSSTRGVDSLHDVSEAAMVAKELARSCGAVIAVTGEEDLITDGEKSVVVSNGHSLMGRVTGTGCVASVIIGAFAGVDNNMLTAAATGLGVYGVAGEMAALTNPGPGSYKILLLDSLNEISSADIEDRLHIS